jgi:hypothetical protein
MSLDQHRTGFCAQAQAGFGWPKDMALGYANLAADEVNGCSRHGADFGCGLGQRGQGDGHILN